MKNKHQIKWLIFFVLILSLSSCKSSQANQPGYPVLDINLNNQSKSPTQEIGEVYPPPNVTTELSTPGYPIENEPTPTVSSVLETTEVISADNVNQLKLTNSLHVDEMVRVIWSNDQKSVAIVGYDHFDVYSFPLLEKLFEYFIKPDEYLVDISPDGVSYVTTANDGFLVIHNWKTGKERSIETGTLFISGEYSPDGSEIMVAHMDEWAASIFNITNGKLVTTISGFETAAPVYDVRFSSDGKKAIWHARATIQPSDIESNKMGTAIYHQDFITSFTTSSDGRLLITSASRTLNDSFIPLVFFYSLESGDLVHQFELSIPAYTMTISPDSTLLAVNNSDSVVIINLQSFDEIYQFPAHPENINQITFSPKGDFLTTTGSDQQVKFWSIP